MSDSCEYSIVRIGFVAAFLQDLPHPFFDNEKPRPMGNK